MGGLGVLLGMAAALLFARPDAVSACLLSGGCLAVALGMTDDVFSLRPAEKLLGMGAVAFLPPAFGLFPRAIDLGGATLPLSLPAGVLLAAALTVLFMNAWNLADGADGLASLLTLSALAGLRVAGRPLAGSAAGATLGFFPYNAPPARLFLGDAGALLLGYAVSVLLLSSPALSPALLLCAAYPLLDLTLAVFRRARRGQSPFAADGAHLHHRLRDGGFSPWILLFWVGAISLALSCLGGVLSWL
jgi:UDP-GlcNAc:undecaprenyl-phosphate GlcNAc-1-phosphate transferase